MLKRLTLLPLILGLSVNAYAEDAPAPSEAASSAAAKALSHAADALTHAAEALKLASEAFQQALEAERKAEEMLAKANEKPMRPGDVRCPTERRTSGLNGAMKQAYAHSWTSSRSAVTRIQAI